MAAAAVSLQAEVGELNVSFREDDIIGCMVN